MCNSTLNFSYKPHTFDKTIYKFLMNKIFFFSKNKKHLGTIISSHSENQQLHLILSSNIICKHPSAKYFIHSKH